MSRELVYCNLPDGWKLADRELRTPVESEYFLRGDGMVIRCGVSTPMLAVIVEPLNDEVTKPWSGKRD